MSETFDCAECATSDDQDRIDALMADHSMPDVPLSDQSIVAPKGYRQRDYLAGWRACEADVVQRGQEIADLEDALERATTLAERYGDAVVAISEALPNVNRARLIIAALDEERHGD